MLSQLPEHANGAYLAVNDGTRSGLVKLFPWSFPLDDFPEESPTISPNQIQGLFINQKGLDDPTRYQLFHLDDGEQVSLQTREVSFQRQLEMTLRTPLPTGKYVLDIPSGGMFAGREYYYFRVDPAAMSLPALETLPKTASLTDEPIPQSSRAASPGFWLEILPLSSTVISAWMAFIMLRRMRQKLRPQEVAWALAFLMFAIAAGRW